MDGLPVSASSSEAKFLATTIFKSAVCCQQLVRYDVKAYECAVLGALCVPSKLRSVRFFGRFAVTTWFVVVVAVLGIISAIGVVSYSGYTKSAKRKSAENIMQQVSLAQTEFYSDYFIYYTI